GAIDLSYNDKQVYPCFSRTTSHSVKFLRCNRRQFQGGMMMSTTPSQPTDGSALTRTRLTLLEGIGMIVGANIGAGVLSLAFGAKNAGWPILVFWVIVAGILTTITMLYVAETTLRTKKNL